MTKWIIIDDYYKICFHGKEFDDFEDAWGFIRETFDHLENEEFDEEMGEYSVVPKAGERFGKYLHLGHAEQTFYVSTV